MSEGQPPPDLLASMTPDAKHIGSVLEVLETAAANEGHCYLPQWQLIHALGELVDFTQAQAQEAIRLAAERGHVVVRGERVYLTHLDQARRDIAQAIWRFLTQP